MTNTKTFRLFISSTFNDFRREREILQTEVFWHIKRYCDDRGYTFHPVDLRWGVSEEAQLDQKTLELCLDEVRTCKSYPHPNFLLMLGDRYGWIPLPYAIETKEFEELLSHVNSKEREHLLEWYREDLNQLPASYILKERSHLFTKQDKWERVESRLRTALQAAVKRSNLSNDLKRKYFLSATEAEIEEGIIPYNNSTPAQQRLLQKDPSLLEIDPRHIFGFFRDIERSTRQDSTFMGDDYDEAQRFKRDVKGALIEENILNVQTTQRDSGPLDEFYLVRLSTAVISFLEARVDEQVKKEKKYSPLEQEQQAQAYFAAQKRRGFMGQKPLLREIQDYIDGETQAPFILHGPSGRGKSALMAQAIEEAQKANSKVLYRFVGATPHSGSAKEILTSLFAELGIDVRSEQERRQKREGGQSPRIEESETFEQFSERIHAELMNLKEEVVIFIDAVDQLGHADQFLWLPRQLPYTVKIIISALDDSSYQADSRYFQQLKTNIDNLHEIPRFQQPTKLLHTLLKKEQRTIQKHQEAYFLKQYTSSASPLYICVAAQELKHWKSFDVVEGDEAARGRELQDLADSQQGIIQEFISNLHDFYHHDKIFVQKMLSYLYASRDGLSESELLQLFATDSALIQRVTPETYHENTTGELPVVFWVRLHSQLQPFLSKKHQDGEELLYFFHREFEDVIKNFQNQTAEHEAVIEAAQELIFVRHMARQDEDLTPIAGEDSMPHS